MLIYQKLASSEGGINGLLSNLKDKDLQGVLDEIKKVGGDDVKRVVEKVEKKVKEAKGDVQKVDWKSLAQELKDELPASGQKAVDVSCHCHESRGAWELYCGTIDSKGQARDKSLCKKGKR